MHVRLPALALATALAATTFACGNSDEPYKATPAWSGRKPSLPSPPTLANKPIKSGDAYTVFGATHHLRSRIHEKEVNGKELSIVGYIVETNYAEAPPCAVHKAGKKDPDDCVSPIPSFWIADEKGDVKGPKIRVLGWASNFANVFEAMSKYKGLKDPPKELYKDEFLAVDVPFPLPAVGAKVKITGKYGFVYHGSQMVSDPQYGVFTHKQIEVLEPAPEPAAFAKK